MNHQVSLNGVWRFAFDPYDEGVDQQWMLEENQPYLENKIRIHVPGLWKNAQIPRSDEPIPNVGWYWKKITLERLKDLPYYLLSPGIHQAMQIYIDGQIVGESVVGGIPLMFDISNFMDDHDHFLSLRVEVYKDPTAQQYPIYSPEFGGLPYGLRISSLPNIFLMEKSLKMKIHRNTPAQKVTYAELEFTLYYQNNSATEFNGAVTIKIERDFLVVSEKSQNINVLASNTRMVRLVLPIDGDNLDLWTLDNPNLYNLHINLIAHPDSSQEKICCGYETIIGIRELRWKEGDTQVNSEKFHPNRKTITLEENEKSLLQSELDCIEFLENLKREGYNIIRAKNFLFPRFVYEIASRIGLLIQGDLPVMNISRKDLNSAIRPYIFAINFYPALLGYIDPNIQDLNGDWEQNLMDIHTTVKKIDRNSFFM